MTQFDVFENPIASARKAYPLVAILQADLADTGRDKLIAPLVPRASMPRAPGRAMPIVSIGNDEYVALVPAVTSLRTADLRTAVGTVAGHRNEIVAAIDFLFLGL